MTQAFQQQLFVLNQRQFQGNFVGTFSNIGKIDLRADFTGVTLADGKGHNLYKANWSSLLTIKTDMTGSSKYLVLTFDQPGNPHGRPLEFKLQGHESTVYAFVEAASYFSRIYQENWRTINRLPEVYHVLHRFDRPRTITIWTENGPTNVVYTPEEQRDLKLTELSFRSSVNEAIKKLDEKLKKLNEAPEPQLPFQWDEFY